MGVFPLLLIKALMAFSLPHARGGVSGFDWTVASGEKSSPRTWGCFYPLAGLADWGTVFPTHVGVFP